jgi:hypothetical protein
MSTVIIDVPARVRGGWGELNRRGISGVLSMHTKQWTFGKPTVIISVAVKSNYWHTENVLACTPYTLADV